MGLFRARAPRKYRPVSIYNDERKLRIQKLVDEVKRENGEATSSSEKIDPDKFRGSFVRFTPHVERYRERKKFLGWPILLMLILILAVIWLKLVA